MNINVEPDLRVTKTLIGTYCYENLSKFIARSHFARFFFFFFFFFFDFYKNGLYGFSR